MQQGPQLPEVLGCRRLEQALVRAQRPQVHQRRYAWFDRGQQRAQPGRIILVGAVVVAERDHEDAVGPGSLRDRQFVREVPDREGLRRVLAVVKVIGAELEHRPGQASLRGHRPIARQEVFLQHFLAHGVVVQADEFAGFGAPVVAEDLGRLLPVDPATGRARDPTGERDRRRPVLPGRRWSSAAISQLTEYLGPGSASRAASSIRSTRPSPPHRARVRPVPRGSASLPSPARRPRSRPGRGPGAPTAASSDRSSSVSNSNRIGQRRASAAMRSASPRAGSRQRCLDRHRVLFHHEVPKAVLCRAAGETARRRRSAWRGPCGLRRAARTGSPRVCSRRNRAPSPVSVA